MSKFYGQVRGQAETIASRRGSNLSGIRASVQSWDGSVITSLDYNEDGALIVEIQVAEGSDFYGVRLFRGTLDELRTQLAK